MEQEQQQSVSIYDFIIPQKVEAFCTFYEPCNTELPPGEAWTDDKLRKFFGCMSAIKDVGDPLQAYVQMLADRGFNTRQISITGEWAIFIKPKISDTIDDIDSIFSDTKEIECVASDVGTETN